MSNVAVCADRRVTARRPSLPRSPPPSPLGRLGLGLGVLPSRPPAGRDSDGVSKAVTSNTSGPVSSFNQSGNGATGDNNGNCGGDNCRIGGSDGADSFAGNVSGGSGGSSSGSGTAGSVGTRGSGGGGGAAQVSGSPASTFGANGGAGEVKYRFLRVQ